MKHFLNKCSCGNIISQCRCPGEWSDFGTGKPVTTIERGCDSCHGSTVKIGLTQLIVGEKWHLFNEDGEIMLSKEDWEYAKSVIDKHYKETKI